VIRTGESLDKAVDDLVKEAAGTKG